MKKSVFATYLLWKAIRDLPKEQRDHLESRFHFVLTISNTRIRNSQPEYAEELAKTEKQVWYEFSQLCEQYGVPMEPFYVHLRNSERLWEALKSAQTTHWSTRCYGTHGMGETRAQLESNRYSDCCGDSHTSRKLPVHSVRE